MAAFFTLSIVGIRIFFLSLRSNNYLCSSKHVAHEETFNHDSVGSTSDDVGTEPRHPQSVLG
jgi:hypothetical protein